MNKKINSTWRTVTVSAIVCILIITGAVAAYNLLLKKDNLFKPASTKAYIIENTYTSGNTSDESISDEIISTENISDEITSSENASSEVETEYIDADISRYVNYDGMTVRTRFKTPENYARVAYPEDSLSYYVSNFPLLAGGSEIMLYNGNKLENQTWRGAVLDLSIGTRNWQQCADSIIRIIADYLYINKRYDEINFWLTNGFILKYSDWADGNRLIVEGNKTRLEKTAGRDTGEKTYRNYLDTVFLYAGTRSLSSQSIRLNLSDIFPGSFFVMGGSPGHAVMVMDVAVNNDTGDIAFLLAQGNMPAQSIHIFLNPLHIDDPWYYVSEMGDTFPIPFRKFETSSLSYIIK